MTKNIVVQTSPEATTVAPIKLQQINESAGQGKNLFEGNLSLIENVKVKLEVVMGETQLTVKDLFNLKNESVIKLDQAAHAPIEVRMDGKTIARGQLVVVDDNLGVAIQEIIPVTK